MTLSSKIGGAASVREPSAMPKVVVEVAEHASAKPELEEGSLVTTNPLEVATSGGSPIVFRHAIF